MPYRYFFLSLFLVGCSNNPDSQPRDHTNVSIAFASCIRQWDAQPAWQSINQLSPDAFIFLGDNVYTDVGDYKNKAEPARIKTAYQEQANNPVYQHFLETANANKTHIYATWDDHDFGMNDAGADYPFKVESKKAFMDFFQINSTVTANDQPGIYRSQLQRIDGLKVQFLTLDTRSFRSPLVPAETTTSCPRVHLGANTQHDATILGDAQWQWLERQLQQPADLRILISSIQLIPTQHCFEKWANFPAERQRLFDLISHTQANGVIVVSGDRHHAEISRLVDPSLAYPLFEMTASGLNSAIGHWGKIQPEENAFRVESDRHTMDNFGSITIRTSAQETQLDLRIHTVTGDIVQQIVLPLKELLPAN